jgi:hypothetical protein
MDRVADTGELAVGDARAVRSQPPGQARIEHAAGRGIGAQDERGRLRMREELRVVANTDQVRDEVVQPVALAAGALAVPTQVRCGDVEAGLASEVTQPPVFFPARQWCGASDYAEAGAGAGLGAGVRRALSSCVRELISSLR